MKTINLKILILFIVLFFSTILSYIFWDSIKGGISFFLKSQILLAIIWTFVLITLVIHYFLNNNNKDDKNSINDKEGLERPFDYFQFAGTQIAVLTSALTLGKEFFLQFNFPLESNCQNFSSLDKFCIMSSVFSLIYYSVIKMKPVCEETFFKKTSSVSIDDNQLNNQTNI